MSNFSLDDLKSVVKSARIKPAVNQVLRLSSLERVLQLIANTSDSLPSVQLFIVQGCSRILCQAWHRDRSVWQPCVSTPIDARHLFLIQVLSVHF